MVCKILNKQVLWGVLNLGVNFVKALFPPPFEKRRTGSIAASGISSGSFFFW